MRRELTENFMLPPPDKQEIELEVASHFRNGDIGNIARYVQRDKGIVSKQLSANCEDKNNVIYYFLLFLWAFDCIRRDLGDSILAIITRERAKWLDDAPAIVESHAALTADVGIQFSEFIEAKIAGKSWDAQIKECVDIEVAAGKLKADLIAKRNAEYCGGSVRSFANQVVNGRRR